MRVVFLIFQEVFSGYQVVCMFDNATRHSAFADNVFEVRNLSLCYSCDQGLLCPDFNQYTGQVQSIAIQERRAKGLKRVLKKRGLWWSSLQL